MNAAPVRSHALYARKSCDLMRMSPFLPSCALLSPIPTVGCTWNPSGGFIQSVVMRKLIRARRASRLCLINDEDPGSRGPLGWIFSYRRSGRLSEVVRRATESIVLPKYLANRRVVESQALQTRRYSQLEAIIQTSRRLHAGIRKLRFSGAVKLGNERKYSHSVPGDEDHKVQQDYTQG